MKETLMIVLNIIAICIDVVIIYVAYTLVRDSRRRR